MFKNLEVIYRDLKELTEKRLSLLIFLALLGINQLVYTYVPGALLLNLLLLGGVLHLFNVRFDPHYTRHLVMVSLFIAASYVFLLFTRWEFLAYSLSSLMLLWIFMNLILYLFGKEVSLERLLGGLSRVRAAMLYFGILYGVIYLITYLFNQIFFLNLPYNGMVFRIANSLSTVAGLMVLFTAKEKTVVGGFSDLLFGKILPKLTILFGTLAVIYSVQVLLGYLRAYPPIVFYVLASFFYLAFVLHLKKGEKQWERKGILLLFIAVTFLYILIRFNVSSKVSGLYRERGFYHEILLLASFCILNIYLFFKENRELWGLKWYSIFVVLVLFLPPFGMMVHQRYELSDVTKRAEHTIYSRFKEDQQRVVRPPAQKEEFQGVFYSYFSKEAMEMDVKGYAYLVELQWHNDNVKQGYSRGETRLELDSERKQLLVKVGEKESVLNLYEEAKTKSENERWIWETDGVKIIVEYYSHDQDYVVLHFRALFRE